MAAHPLTPRGRGSSQKSLGVEDMGPTNHLSCLRGLPGLQGPCLSLPKGFSALCWLPWSWPWPCQSHLVGVQDREDDEVLGLPVTEKEK